MENRTKRALAVMAAVVLVLVMAIVPACKKEEQQFGAQGVTNFTGLQVDQPTSAPTNEPGLLVNNESALGAAVDVQIAGTSALLVDADGNTTIAGTCSGCSISSSSNLVVAGPTAMTTATPMFIANTAADVPDLFVISKDATPVVYVHNDGSSDVVGDLDVGDTLNVDGDIDLDGDGFDVNITAGASIDTDGATNLSASTGDITVDAEAGSVLIIGSEGAADAVEIDANDTVTSGVDIDVGSVSGLTIDGGLVDIGGGSCGVADGDNDVCIAAVLEVDGELEADGAIDADSTSDFADTATFSKGSGNAIVVSSGGAIDANGDVDVDGTSNLDEVDIDGVTNLVVGTEHIGVMSVINASVAYTPTSGTIVTITDGEIWIVHAVLVNVTEDFDTAGNDDAALIIGDDTDTDALIVLADGQLQAADTEGTGFPAGWQGLVPATQGVFIDSATGSNYFIYAPSGTDQTIDYAVSGTAADAGAATVYVLYTRIQ